MEEAENINIRRTLVAKKPADLDPEWFFNQFRPLLNALLQASGLGTVRTTAADTLSVWLQRAVQSTNKKLAWTSNLNTVLLEDDADTIFNFVCDFWTDSGAALGNALRELFTKTIALVAMTRKETYVEMLERWTIRVLKFPKPMRVLYFTLEVLVKHVGSDFVLDREPNFAHDVLVLMDSNALANPIGKTLVTLYHQLGKAHSFDSSWIEQWAPATHKALQNPLPRDHIQVYFLTPFFRVIPGAFQGFIRPLSDSTDTNNDDQMEVLVGCLKVGQDLAILDIETAVSSEVLDRLLRHPSPSLRVGGLSLLVSSPKGSKPVSTAIFTMVKTYMSSLVIESEAGFRHKVFGFLRQFVFRVRGYAYATSREAKKLGPRAESLAEQKYIADLDHKLAECYDFCGWFLDYLSDLIRPGCPYYCVFTGTQLLELLVQSGLDESVDPKFYEKGHIPFPFSIRIFTPAIVRLLVDNITNNYEDIRLLSTKILSMAALPLPHLKDLKSLEEKSLPLISGMRAREGDGGAHIAQLLFHLYNDKLSYLSRMIDKLETEVEAAEKDFASAVMEHNIHGFYLSLRLIFEIIDFHAVDVDTKIIERLVRTVFQIWEIVKPVLCHDSPEGNLPDELEAAYDPELEAQYGPATQVILSYSWRAVKESMSLLRTLLERLPTNLFPNNLIIESGTVILAQLSYVRHRGAFSSVYPTFIACCKRCYLSDGIRNQPRLWLDDNINLIQTHAQYITRRSGGLPYLITAVLTAEPLETRQQLVTETFDKLLTIARLPTKPTNEDKVDLPQVHAFNCIKVLFIESELSTYSAHLVDKSLELAIVSFSNDIWAIRNCAVMLYSALQARVFPVKTENRISARVFFTKFKNVRRMLLNYVRFLEGTSKSVETVYPVLALLARLEGVNGYDGLDEFLPLVMDCLNNKVWKIRELAARTLGSMIPREQALNFSTKLLRQASLSHQNYLHGICLALVELRRVMEPRKEFVCLLESQLPELFFENPCPETRLAFFRVLIGYCESASPGLLAIYDSLSGDVPSSGLRSSERLLRNDIVEYYLDRVVGICDDINVNKALPFLFDSSYEVQLTTILFLDKNHRSLSSAQCSALSAALWKLFKTSNWDIVRGAAIRLFSKVFTAESTKIEEYWLELYGCLNKDYTEDINESALQSLGSITARHFDGTRFNQWSAKVLELSGEGYPAMTRSAALESLSAYLSVDRNSKSTTLLFQLFRFLSDDDCDIRERAAELTSQHLSIGKSTCAYCEQKLAEHILSLPDSTGILVDELLGHENFASQFDKALKVDNVLFTYEKQNLFRNDVAMLDLLFEKLSEATSPELATRVSPWAASGASYLLLRLRDLGIDGILGYCSNPDVFAVYTRLRLVTRLVSELNAEPVDTSALTAVQCELVIHEKCRI